MKLVRFLKNYKIYKAGDGAPMKVSKALELEKQGIVEILNTTEAQEVDKLKRAVLGDQESQDQKTNENQETKED